MPDLKYGTSSFERDRGNLPRLPVFNMFAETIDAEQRVILQSRPGLGESLISMGAGPVSSLFKIEGILADQLFGVSGHKLYSDSTLVGPINGTDFVSFGGYSDRIFVNAGNSVWQFDGDTLGTVAFPDDSDVTKICVGSSRLIAIKKDTGTFYWSDVLSSDIDALSFATAENSPDRLKDMLFIGDTLILFGAETVEFWPVSDNPDLPFQPLIGHVYPTGIKATGCATTFGNSFAWIDSNSQVCIETPTGIVSSPGLQALIENSLSASLWTFRLDGDEFLVVRLDSTTWVLSLRSQMWSEMTSYGKDNWLAQCFDSGFFGCSEDGRVLEWADDHYDLGSTLERSFRAWMPITDAGVSVFSLTVSSNPGQTDVLAGLYSNPVIEIRTSMDGGFNWSSWKPSSLGPTGHYRTRTKWNSLGTFGYPGLLVEIRVTDPVPFRVSAVTINEPFGGV